MEKRRFEIDNIFAVLWGKQSEHDDWAFCMSVSLWVRGYGTRGTLFSYRGTAGCIQKLVKKIKNKL